MAESITVVVAALTAAWKVVEHLETGQSFRDQPHAAGFDKRVAKDARQALKGQGSVEARAAARLLGDPALAAFAADPEDPGRLEALKERAQVGDGLKGLIGPGADQEEVFAQLSRAWVAAALADAVPVEKLLVAKQDVTNDTLLAIINLASDLHPKQDAAAAQISSVLARLRVDPSDLLVRDPFLAQDADLAGAFNMASEVTADHVPPYVARDIDPRLDELLSDAAGGLTTRFVAVAGPTKAGKTRCLLEALSRVTPLHSVYTVRRTRGQDTIGALLTELAAQSPGQPWVVLVDDLYPHLADGAALTAAVRKAGTIDPPGLIVATTTVPTLTLPKAERLTAGINDNDIELIDTRHVELPRQATAAEQARAEALLGAAFATAGASPADLAHFPERLAAIPELRPPPPSLQRPERQQQVRADSRRYSTIARPRHPHGLGHRDPGPRPVHPPSPRPPRTTRPAAHSPVAGRGRDLGQPTRRRGLRPPHTRHRHRRQCRDPRRSPRRPWPSSHRPPIPAVQYRRRRSPNRSHGLRRVQQPPRCA